MKTPPFSALKEISDRLKKGNIKHALGGSGMMAFLGLVDTVQDWDITTDADLEVIKPLIEGLDYEIKPPSDQFASKFLCRIKIDGASIDLIGGFKIKTTDGFFSLPTLVTDEWEGVPVGSPSAWAKAYQLMGRSEKSDLLLQYIKKNIT